MKKSAFFLSCSLLLGVIIGYFISGSGNKVEGSEVKSLSINQLLEHNASVSVTILVLGILTYGVAAFIILFVNGMATGVVLSYISVKQIFLIFLPYVIFELAAYLFFAIISAYLSKKLILMIREKECTIEKIKYHIDLKQVHFLFMWAYMFLLLGAIVEVYL